jgi:hypothetical protein
MTTPAPGDPIRASFFFVGRGLRGEPLEEQDAVELSVDLLDLAVGELDSATGWPAHLLTGLLADRPDPAEVQPGSLYAATDEGVVYQAAINLEDDSSYEWQTWLEGSGGGGGGTSAADTAGWMPLTTVVGGVPDLVWDATDSLIPTYGPF